MNTNLKHFLNEDVDVSNRVPEGASGNPSASDAILRLGIMIQDASVTIREMDDELRALQEIILTLNQLAVRYELTGQQAIADSILASLKGKVTV